MSRYIATLDIGTSKVVCAVAEAITESEFAIRAMGQAKHDGYDQDGWYDRDSTTNAIKSAIAQAEKKCGKKISNIVVGVPTNYCAMSVISETTTYNRNVELAKDDVDELIARAEQSCNQRGKLIDSNVLFYLIDDVSKQYNCIGSSANKLSATITLSYMVATFEELVSKAIASCGINKVKYVNGSDLQARFIASCYNVDDFCLVIDVGHINTTVSLAYGRGILFSKCFDLGSGYITADLAECLNIGYNLAEEVLPKLDLNRQFSNADMYRLSNGATVEAFMANSVAVARIEQIGEYIIKCSNDVGEHFPSNTPIVLTGGGLSYVRGSADCLSKVLHRDIVIYNNILPQISSNELTSTYALIKHGMSSDCNKSLLAKVISFFKGEK